MRRPALTTHALAALLLEEADIEVGFFDGEGHWIGATSVEQTQVDAANWRPILAEGQTGAMRAVIEIG